MLDRKKKMIEEEEEKKKKMFLIQAAANQKNKDFAQDAGNLLDQERDEDLLF